FFLRDNATQPSWTGAYGIAFIRLFHEHPYTQVMALFEIPALDWITLLHQASAEISPRINPIASLGDSHSSASCSWAEQLALDWLRREAMCAGPKNNG
ncbi:MAG: hypothetical protein EB141_12290, partial [Verrucomicrobia bacterium]|nr:hypothetical protein [Verrucomicrobiota bacterium]